LSETLRGFERPCGRQAQADKRVRASGAAKRAQRLRQ
jgi:hypothetical protein